MLSAGQLALGAAVKFASWRWIIFLVVVGCGLAFFRLCGPDGQKMPTIK